MATTIQIYGTLSEGGGGKLQEKSVEVTAVGQVISPDDTYDGMSKVTIETITAAVDENITAGNIKKGVTILGVTGTYGSDVIPPDAGTLVDLLIGTLPTKTTYVEGDALDLSGCVILAEYSNGYQYDVTADCTFTCNDPVTYNDTKIVVSYTDGGVTETLDIPITVAGLPVAAPASTVALHHLNNDLTNAVPNGNDITLYTGVTISYSSGKFGLALSRISSYAAVVVDSDMPFADFQTKSFTWELWIKSTSASGDTYNNILGNIKFVKDVTAQNASSNLFYLNTSNNKLTLNNYLRNQSADVIYQTCPTTTTTDWVHVALVCDQGAWKIFINGTLMSEGLIASSASSYPREAFAFTSTSNNFVIDEVLCCNEAKYVTNFAPNHGPYYIPN